MDFNDVADELYGLVPSAFTAARDAYVMDARKEGDRPAVEALKRLRRPSVGAWLANLLVRERAGDVERLTKLGVALREAQNRLEGDSMRRFSGEGRDAVLALVGEAMSLARGRGQGVSAAASEELEATLDAALADPVAAKALHSGRLTSGLRYSGLGLTSNDPSDAARPESSRRPVRRASPRGSALVAAERELEKARHDLVRAQARHRDAQSSVARAEAKLKELKENAAVVARGSRDAQKAVRAAEKKVENLLSRPS